MDGSGSTLLETTLAHWYALASRPAATPDELARNLEDLYRAVYATDFDALDVAAVKRRAQPLIESVFDLALMLRDRIPEWQARGLMTGGAPLALRNATRILRYTADILGEVQSGYRRIEAGESTYPAFQGPPEWTLMHPALGEGAAVEFRSGDVILVRGRLHNSAAIARIGDVDSQFSHVGLVYVDEDRQQWMVEALIEEGATMSPLELALRHGLGRAVLLRHRDVALAAKAARIMHDRVATSRRLLGRWIPYDFTMELDGDDQYFCSKLVRDAYRLASAGRLEMPSFGTRLEMKNRDFFDRLGVTALETFAPADYEAETCFDVVAEWRDYRVTSALRMQDLLMSKLFEWMDTHDLKFQEGVRIGLMSLAGRLSGVLLPDAAKNLVTRLTGLPKVPRNMSLSTISTIGMLHDTAEPLLQHLIGLEQKRIAAKGRPLHPREVLTELERLRNETPSRIGYLRASAA